jgi:hypothetical protein
MSQPSKRCVAFHEAGLVCEHDCYDHRMHHAKTPNGEMRGWIGFNGLLYGEAGEVVAFPPGESAPYGRRNVNEWKKGQYDSKLIAENELGSGRYAGKVYAEETYKDKKAQELAKLDYVAGYGAFFKGEEMRQAAERYKPEHDKCFEDFCAGWRAARDYQRFPGLYPGCC